MYRFICLHYGNCFSALQILKHGEGESGPLQGDRVSVHYIGILAEDGSKFDSSRESGKRFEFTLGRGNDIYRFVLQS